MSRLLIVIFALVRLGPSAPAEALLEVRPAEIRFGTVLAGEAVRKSFEVANTGREVVRLAIQTLGPPDLRVSFPPELQPGAKAKVSLELGTAALKGPVEARIYVKPAGASTAGELVTISGTVKPVFHVGPLTAALFSVYRGQSAERILGITNNGLEPVSLRPARITGVHFEARVVPVEPGRVYELIVSVPPQNETGRFVESIELDTGNLVQPKLRVPVGVLVKPDLYANPEKVEFGTVSAAAVRRNPGMLPLLTQTVMLKKRVGEFNIKSIESDIAALRFRLDPSGSASPAFRLDVSLAAEALGTGVQSGRIRILTDDPAHPLLTIPVTLTSN